MNTKTFFGGVIGTVIALLVGIVLVLRMQQIDQGANNPLPFLMLLSSIGAVTGGAIASPMPEMTDD